jgi:hypothetical protein
MANGNDSSKKQKIDALARLILSIRFAQQKLRKRRRPIMADRLNTVSVDNFAAAQK